MRLLLLMILVFSTPAFAKQDTDPFRSTAYPLPRFVSLSSDEAYVRSGPGTKYPIQWVYERAGQPVEIILEYDHWRKIRDFDGQVGWLHKSLLSGRRTALVNTPQQTTLYRKPKADAGPAAYLEPGVLVTIKTCDGAWCRIDASGYKGWVEQQNIWGAYPGEAVED